MRSVVATVTLTVSGGRGGLIKAPWFGAQATPSTDSGGFGRPVGLPKVWEYQTIKKYFYPPNIEDLGGCRGVVAATLAATAQWLLAVTVRRAPFLELDRGSGGCPSV